jgi:hypothetical protein
MSCFDNYIGIKSCNLTTPKTGKFLEDLGISIVKLSAISNEALPTGVEYGTRKINEAIEYVLADIQTDFNETPLIATLNEVGNDNTTYSGNVTFKSTCNEARVRIDRFFAHTDTNIDTTLTIEDGSLLTNFAFNTADEVEVNYQSINKTVKLYINDVAYIPKVVYKECFIQDACCDDVYVTQGDTGLEIDYSLVCTQVDCKIANDKNFQNAVLYYVGVLISQDLELSENLNSVVRFGNSENAVTRADIWMSSYEMYAQKARQTFDRIIDKSCCKDCDKMKITWNI